MFPGWGCYLSTRFVPACCLTCAAADGRPMVCSGCAAALFPSAAAELERYFDISEPTTSLMVRALLDSNCFIACAQPEHPDHADSVAAVEGARVAHVELCVSQHTLLELRRKPDSAFAQASSLNVVNCMPFGRIADLAGPISGLGGTLADIVRSDEMVAEMRELARTGSSLRDRGALLDAIAARVDFFGTSDRALCDSAPATRIHRRFGLRTVTPRAFVIAINSTSHAGEA